MSHNQLCDNGYLALSDELVRDTQSHRQKSRKNLCSHVVLGQDKMSEALYMSSCDSVPQSGKVTII